jgi:uncharacterized surface protein with fasciclin (FAS1) repeats
MLLFKTWSHLLLAALAAAFMTACGSDDDDPPPPTPTIVGVAQADARFSVLVEAVTAAGLGAELSAPGTLTVFAPTNDAFTALLAELGLSKAQLLADRPLLTAVLRYHVLGSKVLKAQIQPGKAITASAGGIFKVDTVGSDLVITDGRNRAARITATDVAASNGVVHVIDKVILPADKNIVQTAQAAAGTPAEFSVLVEAVVAADLAGTLSGTGPFTVFAPTDAAFVAALAELGVTKAQLLANKPLLTKILTYHVLPARALKADVPVGSAITTVQGETFTVDATLTITDRQGRRARITATDTLASNGVIHVIDKVILPAP